MRRYLLALIGVFLCAPAIAQGKLELSIAVVSTQSKSLAVGDMANLVVTLTNKSDKPIENLKELTFDRQSVFLQVGYKGSRSFTDTRIHNGARNPIQLKKFKMAAGASKTLAMTVPCLLAEELSVKAVYAGSTQLISTKPIALQIAPKNGQKSVTIKVQTNRGIVQVRLFPKQALGTCHHFVRLVEANFFNGLIFHRVIKNFMIQAGCPNGTGLGGPGYNIPYESNGKKHQPGRLAMAHQGPDNRNRASQVYKDTAGSQFYIVTGTPKHLNGIHTVFGEVIKGMDVVEVHGNTKNRPGTESPITPQRIRRMVVLP
jgi:peptidyl-prolyl cis-trans isomerase B (cyclophilin B)